MPSRKIWDFKQKLEELYFERKKVQGILSMVEHLDRFVDQSHEDEQFSGEIRFDDGDSGSEILWDEEPLFEEYPVYDDYPDFEDEEFVRDEGSSRSEFMEEMEQGCDEYPVYDEEIVPARHVFDEMPKQDFVSQTTLMNYTHGKTFNFSLHYVFIGDALVLQDTEMLDTCLVDNVRLKPKEEQVSCLFDLVSVSKTIGRMYYVPVLEVELVIDRLRWDFGVTRAKQISGKPPTINLIRPHSFHVYASSDCCYYTLQKMENALFVIGAEFKRVCGGTLFRVTYSKHMVQVHNQFSFSLIRNGKIIALSYVSFDSRVDYGAVYRWYLVFHERSLNVGGVDVMSRPFEGLKEKISSNYIRTEFVCFGTSFVFIRNGILNSNGVHILGGEHEVVHGCVIDVGIIGVATDYVPLLIIVTRRVLLVGSVIGTDAYVFLRNISIIPVLYVVANHGGTTRIQIGVMIATREVGVGFCFLTATQWHIVATQWRSDEGEMSSEVLHAYTGCFLGNGADIRVRPDLVDFLIFINHILVFVSMIIVDVDCWCLFPILERTSFIIIGCRHVGIIFSSTGIDCSLHVLHRVETPLFCSLVFGGRVVHNALSVVLFGTVGRFIASALVGKATLYFLLEFSYLYSTSNLHGITIGVLITNLIEGLSSMGTRWLVPNTFNFGDVDPIAEMIVDAERHILYARAEEMQFQVGAVSFRARIVQPLADCFIHGLLVLLCNGFHTLMLARDDYPYLFITTEEVCITAYMMTRAAVMKGTRNDLGMMIPKTWKHEVMGVLVAVMLFPLIQNARAEPWEVIPQTWRPDIMETIIIVIFFSLMNSEHFDMEYLGRIYFDVLRGNEIVFWDVGALLTVAKYRGDFKERILHVLKEVAISNGRKVLFIDEFVVVDVIILLMGARAVLSYMDTMFGDIAAQEVVKACSEMFHSIFQLWCFVSKSDLSLDTDNDDISELRTIPFKGGGDDTDMGTEMGHTCRLAATHNIINATQCYSLVCMVQGCSPTATQCGLDATQCSEVKYMVQGWSPTATQCHPTATQWVCLTVWLV